MKKKLYIKPNVICFQFNCGKNLMAGSTVETKVYSDEFDPESMESLSRMHSFWDDEEE